MRLRLNVVIVSALVSGIGLITLLGLLIGDEFGPISALVTALPIRFFAEFFVRLSVVVVAFTLVIGVLNIFFVNTLRVIRGHGFARVGSLVVLVSFIGTLLSVVFDRNSTTSRLLLNDVQTSIETALGGLIFFALVWGGMRTLKRGVTFGRLLFVLTVVVVLIGALPIAGLRPLQSIVTWLMQVPVNAGAQGILLGIALATALSGLRVLFGQDRQYGE